MIVAFALLVLLTSLPWHAAQIMPDAFTGVCVLTVWLACTRAPTERGTPLLWLAAFLSGLVHFTHLILIIATGAATLAAQGVFRKTSRRVLAERGAVCAAVAALVLGTQTLGNGVFLKRWSPAPVGSAFFSRGFTRTALFSRGFDDIARPGQPLSCAVWSQAFCATASNFFGRTMRPFCIWHSTPEPPVSPSTYQASFGPPLLEA
jgi:hypothetical protein